MNTTVELGYLYMCVYKYIIASPRDRQIVFLYPRRNVWEEKQNSYSKSNFFDINLLKKYYPRFFYLSIPV